MYNSDIRNVVQRLRAEFRDRTKQLGNKNEKGTRLYGLQVDFHCTEAKGLVYRGL